jgi:hypothetical protein
MKPVSATTPGGQPPTDPGPQGASDLLARSARALAEHEESTWTQTRSRVLGAVRLASRGRVLLEAAMPVRAGRPSDRLQVSDQVLVSAMAVAVEHASGARPLRIEVHDRDGVCTGASVHVSAPYGARLDDLAQEVRAAALATITAVLGDADSGRTVDVHVDEVHVAGDDR